MPPPGPVAGGPAAPGGPPPGAGPALTRPSLSVDSDRRIGPIQRALSGPPSGIRAHRFMGGTDT